MSDAAPPPWVKALEHDSGMWRALTGCWGWGPFRGPKDPPLAVAVVVTASAARIGRKTGQKRAAVAKQLRKLADAGWCMRDADDRLVLASWGVPFVFERPMDLPDGATWANPTGDTTSLRDTDVSHRGVPPQLQGGVPTGDNPTPTGSEASPQGYQSSSSCSSSSENVEGSATHDPQPTRETRPHADPARTQSPAIAAPAIPHGVSTPVVRRAAVQANAHLDTAAQRLDDLRAANLRDFAEPPHKLSRELWVVLEDMCWEVEGRIGVWCTRMREAATAYRVKPADQPAWLRKILTAYDDAESGDRPRADALWDYTGRKWLDSVVRPSNAAKPKGKFDGGLGPKRSKARDYDGPGEISPDAARSWV